MLNTRMAALCEQITEQLNEIYKLDTFLARRAKATAPCGPAQIGDIRKLETKLGYRIPPSYKEFLNFHNGWEHFWINFTLSGAGGRHTAHVAKEARETIAWQKKVLAERGYKDPTQIVAWEKKYRRNLFLANHWVIGANFAGDHYIYDLRSRRKNGEMTLYFWNIAYGVSENCGPDFGVFLQRIHRKAAIHLRNLRRKKRS